MSTAAMAGLRTNRVLRPEDKVALAEMLYHSLVEGSCDSQPRDAPLRTRPSILPYITGATPL
ncbi:hypothetical protein DFH09DRAFT_1335733 [Mycena vulgaris]|nr:hypothetical protein DFH09DRAFT_1341275 [Mycena vulgaris]KAJ6502969.1 hypothetical protein DFH09DRAFT_1335733 [Mycena vulgaris]